MKNLVVKIQNLVMNHESDPLSRTLMLQHLSLVNCLFHSNPVAPKSMLDFFIRFSFLERSILHKDVADFDSLRTDEIISFNIIIF